MPDEKRLVVDGWLYYGDGGVVRVEEVAGIDHLDHHDKYRSWIYFRGSKGAQPSRYTVHELARALGLDTSLLGLDEEENH